MNTKNFFAGGVPGETYGQGVRRRIQTAAIIWVFALASLALTYFVFSLSGSIWATVSAAALCGLASSRADVRVDPVEGEQPKQSDKRVWLMLFIPGLVLLGAVAIYAGVHARESFDIFKASLAAWVFGSALGFTTTFMSMGADMRAR